jgi:riboflavin-specific deaminase-like protein
MSLDGFIDDAGPDRLVLSDEEDLDRVDAVRASCDAILVGAGTIRADDPRLLVRSADRRAERRRAGLPASPAKVTVTATGDLDPAGAFFTAGVASADAAGDGTGGVPERLVYCASPAVAKAEHRLGAVATVVDGGDPVTLTRVLADLAGRGVGRLMVEGGTRILTEALAAELVDELHVVVAPFLVGDPAAPRFVAPGRFPHGPAHPMALTEVRTMGDRVLLRYELGDGPHRGQS